MPGGGTSADLKSVAEKGAGSKKTDLVVDEGGQGQVVEEVGKVLPDVGVAVLAQALVVKAVHLGDLSRFVVPAEDRDPVAVPHLERDEERDGLDRVVPSVDIVAHEQVVGVGRVATDPEEFRQVVLLSQRGKGSAVLVRSPLGSGGRTDELTVNVTADSHGASDRLNVRLFDQDFSCLRREESLVSGWSTSSRWPVVDGPCHTAA